VPCRRATATLKILNFMNLKIFAISETSTKPLVNAAVANVSKRIGTDTHEGSVANAANIRKTLTKVIYA
jgi:hypothetical protein